MASEVNQQTSRARISAAEDVAHFSRLMHEEGLATGSAGNISARFQGTEILITASGVPSRETVVDDIVSASLNPESLGRTQGRSPSSELPLHLALYREYENLGAIVHTHSPYALGLSIARRELPFVCNEGLAANSVVVPIAEYGLPSTEALASAAVEAFETQPGTRAVLLANHGVVAIGDSLEKAFEVARYTEWQARAYTIACSVGTPIPLGEEILEEMRRVYGG